MPNVFFGGGPSLLGLLAQLKPVDWPAFPHHGFDGFDFLRNRRGEYLVPVFGDEHVILDPNADIHVLLKHRPDGLQERDASPASSGLDPSRAIAESRRSAGK